MTFDDWIAKEFPRATGYEIDLCRTVWLAATEHSQERILAVGEECDGGWCGPIDSRIQWFCRCGAKTPEQCITETAKP